MIDGLFSIKKKNEIIIEKKIINTKDVSANNYIKLSLGKKNHLKIKVI